MTPRKLIETTIESVLESDDPGLAWLRRGVRQHGFLPLFLGWTEVLGIRPDGTLIRWRHEEAPSVVVDLVEPYWQRFARAQGASRYADLNTLLPQRSEGAADCDVCGGTGHLTGHPHIVCECGGVGWRILDEQHSPTPR